MSDQFEQKKKKDKKNKQFSEPEMKDSSENDEMNSNPYLTSQAADRKKIKELEEQVKNLEARFRLLEDLVPQELSNLSEQVATMGQFVGFDTGEKK
ncbi:MAG: hypothetical protein HQL71_05440 [Magnetococcales bacterium]|nr:hypothetical protein [Magnetococcales bacterium]